MRRLLIFTFSILATTTFSQGAIRVQQIQQIPSEPQQTLTALTADSSGNLIATGTNPHGAFVLKLDNSGNLIFTRSEIGSYPFGVAADTNDDVYWIGAAGTPAFPFPFTNNVLGAPPSGSLPGFVVKLHGTDGSIMWAAAIGAMMPDTITIASDGSVVVTGVANSTSGLTSPGAWEAPTVAPAMPVEIVKLSPGGALTFAATYGGNTTDGPIPILPCETLLFLNLSCPRTQATAVLSDSQNHIWVTGYTNTTDLPLTSTALKTTCACADDSVDAWLADFSADGSQLLYGSYLQTNSIEPARGGSISAAAMDASGRIWLGGSTSVSSAAGGAQANAAGFVMRYDPSANQTADELLVGNNAYVGNIVAGTDGVTGSDATAIFTVIPFSFIAGAPNLSSASVVMWGGSPSPDSISLPANAVGTGLAINSSGSFVVAGAASVATVLQSAVEAPPNVMPPNIAAVTGSATTGVASGQVSPGEIITIWGAHLGPPAPIVAQPSGQPAAWPTTLGGVQVLVGGVAAPLLYVSDEQINAIIPFGVAQNTTTLIVTSNGSASNSARLGVVEATPGVFTYGSTWQNEPLAAALNQDGRINTASNPAAPGSIVSVFATGLGALTPQPPDGSLIIGPVLPTLAAPVLVGSGAQFLEILYAGPAPDEVAGVMQVNFRLPSTVTGAPSIIMFVGNWLSEYFTVWVTGT